MSEIKECPFCGGDAYIEGSDEYRFFVGCRDCFCNVGEAYDRSAMPEHMFVTADEAITAWNRRPAPPVVAAPEGGDAPLRKRPIAWDALRLWQFAVSTCQR